MEVMVFLKRVYRREQMMLLFKSIKALFNGEGEKSEDKITPLYHEKINLMKH